MQKPYVNLFANSDRSGTLAAMDVAQASPYAIAPVAGLLHRSDSAIAQS